MAVWCTCRAQGVSRLQIHGPSCLGDQIDGCYHCRRRVLATGLGNPPVIRVSTSCSVQFGSRPNRKPDPLCLGGGCYPDQTEPCGFLAGFYRKQSLIFANSALWLQLSIWVMIISQFDIYVNDAVLHALLPLILHFVIQSIFVELLWNDAKNWVFFAVTQRILIGSQTGEQEAEEHATLHL